VLVLVALGGLLMVTMGQGVIALFCFLSLLKVVVLLKVGNHKEVLEAGQTHRTQLGVKVLSLKGIMVVPALLVVLVVAVVVVVLVQSQQL
jgi:hypothetical protein